MKSWVGASGTTGPVATPVLWLVLIPSSFRERPAV